MEQWKNFKEGSWQKSINVSDFIQKNYKQYNGDEEVDFYDTFGLDYIVCYPTKSAYKTYVKRFKDRGNSKEWIEKNKKFSRQGMLESPIPAISSYSQNPLNYQLRSERISSAEYFNFCLIEL